MDEMKANAVVGMRFLTVSPLFTFTSCHSIQCSYFPNFATFNNSNEGYERKQGRGSEKRTSSKGGEGDNNAFCGGENEGCHVNNC